VRFFSFDAGLCQFRLTSKYSIFYFQVQYFLLPSTVFFTSRYSTFYFQVQYFLLPGTVLFTSKYSDDLLANFYLSESAVFPVPRSLSLFPDCRLNQYNRVGLKF